MRSTPRLVSTNMITRPSRAAIRVATAFLSVSSMTYRTWCSMVVTAPADGSTEWPTGSVRNILTSLSMFLSSVAENSMRWPSGSTCLSSAVTCGMKPMSVIWSASSRTVIETCERSASPRSMRSLRRPGVATSTSAPRRRAPDCRLIDMPPTTVAMRRLTAVAYGARASVTCCASSRVGTRTSASGAFGCARRPVVRLPEPVRPRPSRSRPAREFGSVAAWIGKGSVTPWAARVFSSASGMSMSSNAGTGGRAGAIGSGMVNSWGLATGADFCRPAPAFGRPWAAPRPRVGRRLGRAELELVMRKCPPETGR